MESKIFIWGEIWGETIKDHHSKTEVQNNIYWTPEKFNINIPSQPPALSSRPYISNNQQGAPGCRGHGGSLFQRAAFRRRAVPAKLHQKVEILSPKIFSQIHPSIKTLLTLGNLENLPAADRLRFFLENWKKATNNPFILKVVQGYQIPLL